MSDGIDDISGGLVIAESGGPYSYILIAADGTVLNWTTRQWEPLGTGPTAAHLKPLTAVTWGSDQWSWAAVPLVMEVPTQVMARVYSTDAAGAITGHGEFVRIWPSPVEVGLK